MMTLGIDEQKTEFMKRFCSYQEFSVGCFDRWLVLNAPKKFYEQSAVKVQLYTTKTYRTSVMEMIPFPGVYNNFISRYLTNSDDPRPEPDSASAAGTCCSTSIRVGLGNRNRHGCTEYLADFRAAPNRRISRSTTQSGINIRVGLGSRGTVAPIMTQSYDKSGNESSAANLFKSPRSPPGVTASQHRITHCETGAALFTGKFSGPSPP
jgi:hypothetical protein